MIYGSTRGINVFQMARCQAGRRNIEPRVVMMAPGLSLWDKT